MSVNEADRRPGRPSRQPADAAARPGFKRGRPRRNGTAAAQLDASVVDIRLPFKVFDLLESASKLTGMEQSQIALALVGITRAQAKGGAQRS